MEEVDSVLFCSLPPLCMQVGRPVKKKNEFILGQKRLGVHVSVISLGLVNLVLEMHVQSESTSSGGLLQKLNFN